MAGHMIIYLLFKQSLVSIQLVLQLQSLAELHGSFAAAICSVCRPSQIIVCFYVAQEVVSLDHSSGLNMADKLCMSNSADTQQHSMMGNQAHLPVL